MPKIIWNAAIFFFFLFIYEINFNLKLTNLPTYALFEET